MSETTGKYLWRNERAGERAPGAVGAEEFLTLDGEDDKGSISGNSDHRGLRVAQRAMSAIFAKFR